VVCEKKSIRGNYYKMPTRIKKKTKKGREVSPRYNRNYEHLETLALSQGRGNNKRKKLMGVIMHTQTWKLNIITEN